MKRASSVLAAAALSLGIAVTTSTPAEAGRGVWDRVAACESGGNWRIKSGNGYYGGLQFSSSTWRAYGGRAYARNANQATKSEQIAIARRTLAAQGPGAWPVCSRKAGLTKSNGGASSRATAAGSKSYAKSTASKKSSVKKSSPKKVKKKSTKARPSARAGKMITVRSGDTLGRIAKRYRVPGGWKSVWKMNKGTVKSPHAIYVGQRLKV